MSAPGEQPEARRSSRRRSRELAVQGLYQWQLAGDSVEVIEKQLRNQRDFDKADEQFFGELLRGVLARVPELDQALQPCLDRPAAQLSPIEHAILLIGAYELSQRLEIPYRVVINEAVELAKTFGGTDGYKYVNGVLDKLAPGLRGAEDRSRGAGGPARRR
ncbi:MAG TPA: transcription antitermination factor NusB [Burkholderiales bacterium]|nr:transcription antitermination factor NusB [Burkholderiales bacterium]